MSERNAADALALRARQVQSLQRQLIEVGQRAEWFLQRVHELEAYVARSSPVGDRARESSRDGAGHTPTGTNGASGQAGRAVADRLTIARLERQIKSSEISLRQKELAIAELAGAVDQVGAEATLLREASEALSQQLHGKEREISDLTATVEERRRLIEDQALAVDEKEREIVDLKAAVESRIGLIEEQSRAVEEKQHEIAALTAVADERLRLVAELAEALDRQAEIIDVQSRAVEEKERVIADLVAVADERLQLIERLDAEAARARAALARLTGGEASGDHAREHAPSS